MRRNPDRFAGHPHLVLCGVEDAEELLDLSDALRGIDHETFYDVDLGGGPTAIATVPVRGNDRKLFRKLRLIEWESLRCRS